MGAFPRLARLLSELRPHVEEMHAQLAAGLGPLKLELTSQAAGDGVAARAAALRERLAAARARELERGTTLVGPQLDDVRILGNLGDRIITIPTRAPSASAYSGSKTRFGPVEDVFANCHAER